MSDPFGEPGIGELKERLAAAEELIAKLQRDEYVKRAAEVILDLESRLASAEKRIKELEEALRPFASPLLVRFEGGEWRYTYPDARNNARRALGLEVEP